MVKNLPANAGDSSLVCESGRSPEENGNSLQYYCLGSPLDSGAWRLQSIESQSRTQLATKQSNSENYLWVSSAFKVSHIWPLSLLSKCELLTPLNTDWLLFYLFIWAVIVFVVAQGLFSSCSQQGLRFLVVGGLLIAGASLVAEHRLSGTQASVAAARGLRSWNSQALELPGLAPQLLGRLGCLLCCMWDLPGPGIEPVFPALVGGFLSIAPSGNS